MNDIYLYTFRAFIHKRGKFWKLVHTKTRYPSEVKKEVLGYLEEEYPDDFPFLSIKKTRKIAEENISELVKSK